MYKRQGDTIIRTRVDKDEDPAGSVDTVFNDGKEDSRMEDSFASLNDLLDYDENVVTGNAADMVYDN